MSSIAKVWLTGFIDLIWIKSSRSAVCLGKAYVWRKISGLFLFITFKMDEVFSVIIVVLFMNCFDLFSLIIPVNIAFGLFISSFTSPRKIFSGQNILQWHEGVHRRGRKGYNLIYKLPRCALLLLFPAVEIWFDLRVFYVYADSTFHALHHISRHESLEC